MIVYENSNELCITLPAAKGLKAGVFCYLDNDGVATEAGEGDAFVGYVKQVRNGKACVQLRGIMRGGVEDVGVGPTHLIMGADGLMSSSSGLPAVVLYASPVTGEYYLTDVPKFLISAGHKVDAFILPDETELAGVNTEEDLKEVERILGAR